MKITNIYLGFEQIKKDIKCNRHFMETMNIKYNADDKEVNEQIHRFLDEVIIYGMNRRKVSELLTAKEYNYSERLLLIDYLGYTFLYAVSEKYCTWINYAKVGEEICKPGIIHLWDYLPCLDEVDLYRYVSGANYYVVNTYEAFIKYNGRKTSQCILREDNLPFYEDIRKALKGKFNDFQDEVDSWLRLNTHIKEGEYTLELEKDNYTLYFTCIVTDMMIVITDCNCIYKAKLIV